jgi:PAS domain S-box-containing protein
MTEQEAMSTLARLAYGVSSSPGPAPPPEKLKSELSAPVSAEESIRPKWSEQAFRSLIEMLPDAIVVIARKGTIVLINEQTERVFGYRREELLGRPLEILLPERFRRHHVEQRAGYFATPHVRPMGVRRELFGRRKDGSEFPVEISLSPLFTEEGIFATSAIRDVSQRKLDEAKFRTLVENIPAVTFIAPLDQRVPELYVSPQIEKLLGFSQKEWLEDPVLWHRQLHPDDRERWNREFAPTCATGQPFKSIYRFVARDGKAVWVHGSASVVRDADGTPSFLEGVAFDITSIKEAEDSLREQTRLALLLAEVSAAITQSDSLGGMMQRCAEAVITHLGAALARVWSFNERETVLEMQASAGLDTHRDGPHGRVPLGQFQIGLIAARREPLCTNTVVGDERIDNQEWARRQGMVAFAGYPLLIEKHLVGVFATFSRRPFGEAALLTLSQVAGQIALGIERMEAEEKLRQINADLERRVKERTRELDQSLAELRDKTDELRQFAYVASHDLHNPLRSLVNYPERIARNYGGKLDAQFDEWINRTINGAKRMWRLIDDISRYSKYLQHDQDIQPADCATAARNACANLQAAIDESGAEVVLEELPMVQGSPTHLMLLFQNLIGNAIKFRDPERPVRVEVGMEKREDSWLFHVRDNGIGIAASYLEKVFELGRRLHSSDKFPGSGFGLSICAKIVARHGGRIWVESLPGQGSTFFFTLPALPSGPAFTSPRWKALEEGP